MERNTINLREDRIVVIDYDESVYRPYGERKVQHTVIGTPEQIGERVKQTIITALGYGSHVNGVHIHPITPYNIVRLEGDGA